MHMHMHLHMHMHMHLHMHMHMHMHLHMHLHMHMHMHNDMHTSTTTTYLLHTIEHLLPRPRHTCICMSVAGAASSYHPLPHAVELEAAVGDPDLGEQVKHDHTEVGDALVACSLFVIQRCVLGSGEGDLLEYGQL